MILSSFEIPKTLFPFHDFISDYPYVLAHKLWKGTGHYDEEYANFYKEKLKTSSYSILDCGAFELGESIPSQVLFELGEEYLPTHIVLPDVAFDRGKTLERTNDYLLWYGKDSTPKFIACIQGQGVKDLLEVYDLYSKTALIDIIAISCCVVDKRNKNRLARVEYVRELIWERGYLNKKIHLLGCKHPNEFLAYEENEKQYIKSIDTSAPIVYGWNGYSFLEGGIPLDIKKPEEKLADHLDIELSDEKIAIIANNVKIMRSYIN